MRLTVSSSNTVGIFSVKPSVVSPPGGRRGGGGGMCAAAEEAGHVVDVCR